MSDEPYALVFDANGVMLRIQMTREIDTPPYTTLGWHVDDVAATVRMLGERGVVFERYGMGQDDLGIWTTPGARIAWFKDPDGNLLSLRPVARATCRAA